MNLEQDKTEYRKYIEQYTEFKNQMIIKAKNSTDEFKLEDTEFDIDEDVLERLGIDNDKIFDDYLSAVSMSLPSTVNKLKVPIEFLEYPNLLKKFPYITSLIIDGHEIPSYDQINEWLKGSNINTVFFKGDLTPDYFHVEDSFVATCKNKRIFKNDKFQVLVDSSFSDEFFPSTDNLTAVYLNYKKMKQTDASIIRNFLKQYFESDIAKIDFYSNNKHIYSYFKNNESIPYFDSKNSVINSILIEPIEQYIEDIKLIYTIADQDVEFIIINTQNKTYKDITKLKELEKISQVEIRYDYLSHCSIDDYKLMRDTIDYYVSIINENDLSQAEKICYAYDLIKARTYKDNMDNPLESRQIHSIVKNGKIVCVGYSRFLSEILKELGIKSYCIHDDKHQRNIIEVSDDKYGIYGKYAFDCTWDCNQDIYLVIRNGKEKITSIVNAEDEIIKKYNNLSSFNYAFIPAHAYELSFLEPLYDRELDNLSAEVWDPNDPELKELNKLGLIEKKKENTGYFEDAPFVDFSTFSSLIYNTRIYEGFDKQTTDLLIGEVKELRYYSMKENIELSKAVLELEEKSNGSGKH